MKPFWSIVSVYESTGGVEEPDRGLEKQEVLRRFLFGIQIN